MGKEKYVPEWIAARIADLHKPEDAGGLPGWCLPSKAEFIAREVLHDRLVRAVEIGVFAGRSLIPVAMAFKEIGSGFIVGIDPYKYERQVEGMEAYPEHLEFGKHLQYEDHYQATLSLIQREALGEYCGILRASAHEVRDLFGPLDYLHVDGCHSDISSYRDVTMWAPKVRRGGLVILDDAGWPQLQKARGILAGMCEPPLRHPDGWECYRKL